MINTKIKCPHVLIDILIKYYNYKDYNQILEIKHQLYIIKVQIKKILMNLIYETHQNKHAALYRKIRSSESCCLDYYMNLCVSYDFFHICLWDFYNYEYVILQKLYHLFKLKDTEMLNAYYVFHDNGLLHKYVFTDEYERFINFMKCFY